MNNKAVNNCHGVICNVTAHVQAGHLINPEPNTLYKQTQMDMKEGLYASRQNAPLGSIHDQAPGLPEGMDIVTTIFGRPVVKGKLHTLNSFS